MRQLGCQTDSLSSLRNPGDALREAQLCPCPDQGWQSEKRNKIKKNAKRFGCCIFWTAFGCCTLQTLVEICFSMFFVLKSWERKKLVETFSKKCFFLVCTVTLVKCLKTNLLLKFSSIFVNFHAFSSFLLAFQHDKHKKHILTSISSAQHPNAGRNIHHLGYGECWGYWIEKAFYDLRSAATNFKSK